MDIVGGKVLIEGEKVIYINIFYSVRETFSNWWVDVESVNKRNPNLSAEQIHLWKPGYSI